MESGFKLKPLGARILVELIKPETVTKEGIILPNAIKANQNKAKVVELGDGLRYVNDAWAPFPYAVGDTLLLSKYAGFEVGDDLLIVNTEDVLGILE
jgi:chaperonin GroES